MAKSANIPAPELICYAVEEAPPEIVPAHAERDWMDMTDQRYAYRCIPMTIANASGWEILCPFGFKAYWDGGRERDSIVITSEADPATQARLVSSHFGHGILTFHPGYLFRTNPGWAVWARGSPNLTKRHLAPLEGLIETDWLPFTFTMNWRFTRMGTARFEKDEPFCFVTLVPHMAMDDIQPSLRKLSSNSQLETAHKAWSASRDDFNRKLAIGDSEATSVRWQKTYVRGQTPQGQGPGPQFHLSKRRMKSPKPE